MSLNNDNSKGSGDILALPTKGTTIKHGDLCVYDGGTHDILPATGANQDIYLVGVAQTASMVAHMIDSENAAVTAQVTPVAFSTRGVFTFAITSGTYYLGDKVKIAGPQEVAKCSTNETAIGVITKVISLTSVEVKIGGAMTNQNLFIG